MDAQYFAKQVELNSIKALSGSCICCSGIVELRNIVNRIPERQHGITLIEANGTSDACSLMEFLGVGINDRFLPPIQISVVDVKNWQKRGEHNELESNQIQVSSLIVLTHLDTATKSRQALVTEELKILNPMAKIITMDTLEVSLLPELLPSNNAVKKIEHQKAHWSSCSIDLPVLPNLNCIEDICINLPQSILRVKGCVQIGSKLLTIGPGSEPYILEEAIKLSLNSSN